MKEQIVNVVANHPKRYKALVSQNPEMKQWVDDNCLTTSTDVGTRIYSAVHQEPSICKNGSDRVLKHWDTGYKFCGPAANCKCLYDFFNEQNKTRKARTKEERDAISEKRAKTNLEKYGTAYPVHKNKAKPGDRLHDGAKVLLDKEWLVDHYETQKKSMKQIAEELSVDNSTVNWYIEFHGIKKSPRSNKSTAERKVAEYIYYECEDSEIYQSDTTVIHPHELDITAPNAKLAIEYNGIYYHSQANDRVGQAVSLSKHREKTLSCISQGISLLQLTDYTWSRKTDYPKTWIKRLYGRLPKYDRTCIEMREVPLTEANAFHLVNGPYGLDLVCDTVVGLYHSGELIEIFPLKNTLRGVIIMSPTSKVYTDPRGSIDSVVEYSMKVTSSHHVFFHEDLTLPIPGGVVSTKLEKTDEILDDYLICDNNKFYNNRSILSIPGYDRGTSIADNAMSAGYRVYYGAGLAVWKLKSKEE